MLPAAFHHRSTAVLYSAISTAIAILLREVENATDVFFTTMSRSNWSNLNQVSGQSHYVGDLVKAAEQAVENIKPLIEQKKYLRNFLDKVCRCVVHSFSFFGWHQLPLETNSGQSTGPC